MAIICCNSNKNNEIVATNKTQNGENIIGNLIISDTDKIKYRKIISDINKSSLMSTKNEEIQSPELHAREILKTFAYCNCLSQSLILDSFFSSTDNSRWFLQVENISYPNIVFDSVQKITNPIVKTFCESDTKFNTKNYSLFCLDFYRSHFLDSVVNSFDALILKEE